MEGSKDVALEIVDWAMGQQWYALVMEGEVEVCENCKGPECECVKRRKRNA